MTAELGRFGLWTSYRAIGEENAGEAAQLAQRLGFGTVWLGGSPDPARLEPMLAATDSLTAATGIVNIWQTDPDTAAAERARLADRYPDRVMIGIGLGHPEATSDYKHPLRAMRAYLDALDAHEPPLPANGRCLAALAPRMLDLCAERTRGTHSYFVSPEHTRFARERLGPDALIAAELACVLDTDAERARATGRKYAHMYLQLSNYTNNLLRFEFAQSDIEGDGSDRLIDTIVPHGTADEIAAAARAHIEAGANHVCLQTVGVRGVPTEQWTALAGALGL